MGIMAGMDIVVPTKYDALARNDSLSAIMVCKLRVRVQIQRFLSLGAISGSR